MSQILHNTIQAVTHGPNSMERPLITAAAVGLIGASALAAQRYHGNTNEKGATDARNNGDLINKSLIGTEKDTDKQRFSPVKTLLIGTGLVGVQLLGQPTYEATFEDANSEVVVVTDASNSMLLTKDLGNEATSRYAAVRSGIDAATFKGSLGFVETAGTARIVSKPTTLWQEQAKALAKPGVDPNGGQFVPALEQAASLLTLDQESKKRDGTIVVISDGTIAESAKRMSDEAAKLKKEGVTVRVVVPGTPGGNYRLPNAATSSKATNSGVKPDTFKDFDNEVSTPQTVQEVKAAVEEEITSAGTRREQRDWPVPGIIGGAIMALAVGRFAKDVITRKRI